MSKYIDRKFLFNIKQTTELLEKYPQFNAFYLDKNNKYLKSKKLIDDMCVISDLKFNWFIYPLVGQCTFLLKDQNNDVVMYYKKKSPKIKNIFLNNKRQLLYINGEYHWSYNGTIGQNVHLKERRFQFNEKRIKNS